MSELTERAIRFADNWEVVLRRKTAVSSDYFEAGSNLSQIVRKLVAELERQQPIKPDPSLLDDNHREMLNFINERYAAKHPAHPQLFTHHGLELVRNLVAQGFVKLNEMGRYEPL